VFFWDTKNSHKHLGVKRQMRIGYIRVSTDNQNIDRQLENIELDKKFVDIASGSSRDRPQYQIMMDFVREGDTLYVDSMDRLARNLDDLRQTVQKLVDKKVKVQFVKESMIFSGEENHFSLLLLSVLGAFAEFERSISLQRQREGIELAKKRGVYKGRQPTISEKTKEGIREKHESGYDISSIARSFGVSRASVYRFLGDTQKIAG
jgi:DNA invertase Pin-like site-specific DNA recombinase